MAWLSGWDNRIELAIGDYAGDIGAEVTWFPVTAFLTATQAEEVFTELTTDAEYMKVAFTKADGTTELYADCELFDVSETKGIFHISRDGWTINANTTIYIYYDKDHADNDTYISMSGGTAAQSVYDANFKAVYHMHDGEPAYDTRYEATVEPDSDGWTLGGTDYASVSAGILTIDTSADDSYTCYYYKTPDVDFNAGFYLKTRVKASTDMDDVSDGLLIQIQDGTQNEQFKMWIRDGEVAYFYESNNTGDFVLDTSTAYVTYEIYIKATAFWIYADGVQKAANTIDSETVTDLVQFGDISPDVGQMCKAQIDYVYYALGVTDNPILTILDSTSNNNDGTKKAVNEPIEATGKVGQGQDFAGDDDYISAADSATFDFAAGFTLESIADPDATDAYGRTISRYDITSEDGYFMGQYTTGSGVWFFQNTVGGVSSALIVSNAAPSGAFQHVVGVRAADGVMNIYVDGAVQTDTDTNAGAMDSDGDLYLGVSYDGSANPFAGIMDEVRISGSTRSAAWIKGTYNSLWDTLLTYGSEETAEAEDNAIFFGAAF